MLGSQGLVRLRHRRPTDAPSNNKKIDHTVRRIIKCALTNDKPYIRELVGDFASMSALHIELFMAEARAEAERVKRKAVLLLAAIN